MLRIVVASAACFCVVLPEYNHFNSSPLLPSQASSLIERDSAVARREPGPHDGGGETTAYSFFSQAPNLELVFRKRALHRGSAIGYHRQHEDEIYYVLSGTGELTLNGQRSLVGPGTAVLTRPGSSHGLRQMGSADLVLVVAYQQPRDVRER